MKIIVHRRERCERKENLLAKASQKLSTASFEKIWDNKEVAVYDSL